MKVYTENRLDGEVFGSPFTLEECSLVLDALVVQPKMDRFRNLLKDLDQINHFGYYLLVKFLNQHWEGAH